MRKIGTKGGGEPKTFAPSWNMDDGSYGPADSGRMLNEMEHPRQLRPFGCPPYAAHELVSAGHQHRVEVVRDAGPDGVMGGSYPVAGRERVAPLFELPDC